MDTSAPLLSTIFGIMDVLMWFALGITIAIAIAYYVYAILKYRQAADGQASEQAKHKMIRMAIYFGIVLAIIVVLKILFPVLQGVFAGRVV